MREIRIVNQVNNNTNIVPSIGINRIIREFCQPIPMSWHLFELFFSLFGGNSNWPKFEQLQFEWSFSIRIATGLELYLQAKWRKIVVACFLLRQVNRYMAVIRACDDIIIILTAGVLMITLINSLLGLLSYFLYYYF